MLNEAQRQEFRRLRREIIEQDYMNLNPQQRQAVMTAQGPLLILAGAGSGKTTALIHRVACLLKYGRGAECAEIPDFVNEEDLDFLRAYRTAPVPEDTHRKNLLCTWDAVMPWSILAITFTNKAAGELKDRLARMLGADADGIWASTFHSACLRILRRDIGKLGMQGSFTIYDADDSRRVIREILQDKNWSTREFDPRSVLGSISRAKDEMETPEKYMAKCRKDCDDRRIRIAEIYEEYQRRLWDASALDFDDIIFFTVRLLQEHEDVRQYYQNKFRYVLVDEYQDTNHMQYLLISLLAGKRKNICVVGDDDQSIFRFRGADIGNILSFEDDYPNAKVIRLEQNYRSTGNILAAANAVISNNQERKGKNLWTEHEDGEKLALYTAGSEEDEAAYVAKKILRDHRQGGAWRDHAILYRMNAQSRVLEQVCRSYGIPYRVVGGMRFFDRSEVKDMLAYLAVVHNPDDNLRLQRILNVPARGIGQRTVEQIRTLAEEEDCSLWDIIRNARNYPQLERAKKRLLSFANMLNEFREVAAVLPLPDFYQAMVDRTGYVEMLRERDTVENRSRIENVGELASSIQGYVEHAGDSPSLAGFLDEIALYTDLDSVSAGDDSIMMMTIHSAKGLEFPHVYVVGMEEGIFPGFRVIGDPEEEEEERRLCYVAMTRAKRTLTLTCASQRMLFGQTVNNRASRFTGEIPSGLLEKSGQQCFYGMDPYHESAEYHPQQPQRSRAASFGTEQGSRAASHRTTQHARVRFHAGDLVEHAVFGTGMVTVVQPMGGDAMLEVAFDSVGTKRMMQNSASKFMKKRE